MPCSVGYAVVLMAGHAWILRTGAAVGYGSISFGSADDLPVTPPDHVCKLYAVFMYGYNRRGSVLE